MKVHQSNSKNMLVVGAIFSIVILLAVGNEEKVYALTTITYTTTGTQSNDNCISGIDDFSHTWLFCNPTNNGANSIISVTDLTGHQLATLTTTITIGVSDRLLSLYSDSSSILLYVRGSFIKYFYTAGANAGGSIQLTGSLTPGSCTNSAGNGVPNYDVYGYLWYPCPTQNTIGAMNPATMTDVFRSTALVNTGSASSCNNSEGDLQNIYTNPTFNINNKGQSSVAITFIKCTSPQEIYFINSTYNAGSQTFTQSIGTLSMASNSNYPDIYVDDLAKRIVTQDTSGSLGIDTITYTLNAGNNFIATTTGEKSHFGASVNSLCQTDFHLQSTKGHILYCVSTNQIQGFYSNTTTFINTFNLASYSVTFDLGYRVISTYNAGIFIVAEGIRHNGVQDYFSMTNTATTYGSTNPNGGTTGSTGQTTFTNSAGDTCINIYDKSGTVLLTTYCSLVPGGPIVSPNTIGTVNTGANITSLGNVLGCGLGLTSCTNSNIQTNGVGLFLLLILIIFSYAMLVSIHYKVADIASHGQVQLTQVLSINPMLLLVMLIADVGIAFFVNWISGLIFYTMIIAIAGLTAFGIYRHVKGDSG